MNLLFNLAQVSLLALFIYLCFRLGWVIISLSDLKNQSGDLKTPLGMVLGVTIFPLIVYLIHLLFGLKISLMLTTGLMIISLILSHLLIKRYQFSLHVSFRWICIFLIGLSLMTVIRLKDERMAGADIYTYLHRTGEVVIKGETNNNFDRNIINTMSGSLSIVSDFPPFIGLKLFSALTFALTGIIIGSITQFLTNRRLATLASLVAYTNLAHFRLSLDIIAMHYALLVLGSIILILLILSRFHNPGLFLILALFWGSLFNSHGLMAYASLLLVGVPIVILSFKYLIKNIRQTLLLLGCFVLLFTLSAQPLLLKGSGSFVRLFLKPILTAYLSEIPNNSPSTQPQVSENNQRISTNKAATTEINVSPTFPYNINNILELYQVWILIGSFFSFFILVYFIRWSKSDRLFLSMFLWFTLGLIGLTQQALFGFDWYSARFVLILFLVFIPLSLFGFDKVVNTFKNPTSRIFAYSVLIIVMFINLKPLPNQVLAMFTPQPDRELYNFFTQISDQVPVEVPIFAATSSDRAAAINPDRNIIRLKAVSYCQPPKKGIDGYMYDTHLAFSYFTTPEESRRLLGQYHQEYYVLINTINDCLNQEVLSSDYYQPIMSYKNYQLLKSKP